MTKAAVEPVQELLKPDPPSTRVWQSTHWGLTKPHHHKHSGSTPQHKPSKQPYGNLKREKGQSPCLACSRASANSGTRIKKRSSYFVTTSNESQPKTDPMYHQPTRGQ
ncbi:hypothetical protein Nepgr_007807 [Nepenthes gracilis]|uniref:Uncharacterized protein n=1 Tax=Nepenthes gracilis TaxID=150966 RepID=A0AAD3XIL7_NEPGR|nr:hypothetical protein Nepgr_007807 [Nepenthes gracilis]